MHDDEEAEVAGWDALEMPEEGEEEEAVVGAAAGRCREARLADFSRILPGI